MLGITFDTGALIGLERRRARISKRIELVDSELGKLAGEAAAAITRATAVDAIVMASAARRGDVVYTSDVDDLQRLSSYFPSVRILAA